MDALECFPMGSSALLLAWKEPREVNGVLTGYRIYYQVSKSCVSVAVAIAGIVFVAAANNFIVGGGGMIVFVVVAVVAAAAAASAAILVLFFVVLLLLFVACSSC